jgi:hypothetical protein
MATVAGKIGKVQLAGATVAEIDDWTFNPSADVLETTAFGATSKTRVAGLMDNSGSFKGRLDTTDTNGQVALRTALLAGAPIALALFTDATHAYRGSAILKGAPAKSAVATLVDVQYDFMGTGDWTWS